MSRLNIFLLIVVLGCALSVVSATNQQRQFFIAVQRAQSQQYALQQDYAQLQYQQSALSKTSRIEGMATASLKMQPVSSGRTQYLTIDPATAPAIDPPASAAGVGDAEFGLAASNAGAAASPANTQVSVPGSAPAAASALAAAPRVAPATTPAPTHAAKPAATPARSGRESDRGMSR